MIHRAQPGHILTLTLGNSDRASGRVIIPNSAPTPFSQSDKGITSPR
jgi:hypothetical protein